MFNKYIKTQYVCISVSELFDWWDRLDSNPDNAFELFTEFLENAEDTLEVEPGTVTDEEFVPLKVCCEEDLFDSNYDEFSKRTNDAYKRMKNDDSKWLNANEFINELDSWTEDCDNITYNPYGWNIKAITCKKSKK